MTILRCSTGLLLLAAVLVGGLVAACAPEAATSSGQDSAGESAGGRIEELIGKAQAAADRRDLSGAAAYLDAALLAAPHRLGVRQDYVRVLLQAGRAAEGESIARAGLEQAPENLDWYILVGACQADQGKAAEAMRTWLDGLDIDPAHSELRRLLGDIYLEQGLVADAIALHQQALETNPDDANATLRLGAAYETAGRFSEALQAYHRAVELDPNQAQPFSRLGSAYLRVQQPKRAAAVFRRGLEIHPEDGALWQKLGVTLSTLGQTDEGLLALIRALQLENRNGEYWRTLLGLLHRRLVSDEEEKQAASPPAWAAPAAWHHQQALNYAQTTNMPQSVHHFVQSLWTDLDQPRIHNDLGVTLVTADQPAWAVPFFEAALLLDPAADGVRRNLEICHAALAERRRQVELAAAAQAVEEHPERPANQYRLGAALATAGDWSNAVHHLETAVQQDASNLTYRAVLSRALNRVDRPEDAVATYEPVLRAYPEDPSVQHLMAELLLRQAEATPEQRDRALQLARQAAASSTNDSPQYLRTVAAAQAALEDWPAARDTVARALAAANTQGNTNLVRALQADLQFLSNPSPAGGSLDQQVADPGKQDRSDEIEQSQLSQPPDTGQPAH